LLLPVNSSTHTIFWNRFPRTSISAPRAVSNPH